MANIVVHKKRSGATRQAEYAARMKADGHRQRTFWLTEEESLLIDKLLSGIRRKRGGADE
jgi:hypothetical protein